NTAMKIARQTQIRNQWIQCWSSAMRVTGAVRFSWLTFGPPGMSGTAAAIVAQPPSDATASASAIRLMVMLPIPATPRPSIRSARPPSGQRTAQFPHQLGLAFVRHEAADRDLLASRHQADRLAPRSAVLDPHPRRLALEPVEPRTAASLDRQALARRDDPLVIPRVPPVRQVRNGQRAHLDQRERNHDPRPGRGPRPCDQQRHDRQRAEPAAELPWRQRAVTLEHPLMPIGLGHIHPPVRHGTRCGLIGIMVYFAAPDYRGRRGAPANGPDRVIFADLLRPCRGVARTRPSTGRRRDACAPGTTRD